MRTKHIRCQSATEMRINNNYYQYTDAKNKKKNTKKSQQQKQEQSNNEQQKIANTRKRANIDERTPVYQFREEYISGDSEENLEDLAAHYWKENTREQQQQQKQNNEKIFVHTMNKQRTKKISMRGILGQTMPIKSKKKNFTRSKVMPMDITTYEEEEEERAEQQTQYHLHFHIHHHDHHHYHHSMNNVKETQSMQTSPKHTKSHHHQKGGGAHTSRRRSTTAYTKETNNNNRRHSTAVASKRRPTQTKKSSTGFLGSLFLKLKPLLANDGPPVDDDAELHRLESLLRERRARLYQFNHQLKPLSEKDRIAHETMLAEIKKALADIKLYRQQHKTESTLFESFSTTTKIKHFV